MAKKETLIIVAHPDDETIWMGGTLLKSKEKSKENKTIISLCRKNDSDRAPKFEKVCEKLGSKGYIFDLDDGEEGYYKEVSAQEIMNKILEITKDKKYDSLYTHGENGEYGHIRHLDVHKAVCEMLEKGSLVAEKVFFFSYFLEKEGGPANINPNADKLIKLEKPYFKMKKQLIQEVYGFQEGGFEVESSREMEAFDIKK
jgi:LmbE family N-acetylglucosaminyl deacetylase